MAWSPIPLPAILAALSRVVCKERALGTRSLLIPALQGLQELQGCLQPETLADGNWLVKQNQLVSKIEIKSDTNLRSLYES
jgi:hypothetical protein